MLRATKMSGSDPGLRYMPQSPSSTQLAPTNDRNCAVFINDDENAAETVMEQNLQSLDFHRYYEYVER